MTPGEKTRSAISQIAFWHDVTSDDILGPSRHRKHFIARRDVAFYLKHKNMSLGQIGRVIHRHHTSVLSMLAKE